MNNKDFFNCTRSKTRSHQWGPQLLMLFLLCCFSLPELLAQTSCNSASDVVLYEETANGDSPTDTGTLETIIMPLPFDESVFYIVNGSADDWTFNDSTTVTEYGQSASDATKRNQSAIWSAGGTETADLTVEFETGCKATTPTHTVIVNETASPVADKLTAEYCVPEASNLPKQIRVVVPAADEQAIWVFTGAPAGSALTDGDAPVIVCEDITVELDANGEYLPLDDEVNWRSCQGVGGSNFSILLTLSDQFTRPPSEIHDFSEKKMKPTSENTV